MKTNYMLLAISGVIIYWVLHLYSPFLYSIVIASLLAISTVNIHQILAKKKFSKITIASVITALITIVFFGPIIYFIITISTAIAGLNPDLVSHTINKGVEITSNLPEPIKFLQPQVNSFISSLDLTNLTKNIIKIFASIGASSAIFLKDIFLIIVFFFFAHLHGEQIGDFFKKIICTDKTIYNIMIKNISDVMSITIYSTIITAVFEGALFALAVGFLRYDLFIFGILYGFASLVPIIGGAIMWLPIAIYEIYLGNSGNALFIALYSIVVISIIADTFIKPIIIDFVNSRLLKKQNLINPLIIFFAMVAGLSTYGFWGIVIGPAVTTLFVSLLYVYKNLKKENISSRL